MEHNTMTTENNDNCEQVCWICFESGDELVNVCDCPSRVHKQCLAKWQLHNIGKPEEQNCRFCQKQFPHWKETYKSSKIDSQNVPVKVLYQGVMKTVLIEPDNMENFKNTIRNMFDLPNTEINFTYICKIPEETNTFIFNSDGSRDHEYQSAAYLAAYSRANAPLQSSINVDSVDSGDRDSPNDVIDDENVLGFWERVKMFFSNLVK